MNQVTQDMNIMYKQSKSYYTKDKLNMDLRVKSLLVRMHNIKHRYNIRRQELKRDFMHELCILFLALTVNLAVFYLFAN